MTGELLPESAFVIFDNPDSGCISYGVESGGDRWFVKRATTPAATESLRRAFAFHARVHHAAIVAPADSYDHGAGLTVVYPWRDGVVLNHATAQGPDRSGLARFQTLPIEHVHDALTAILAAHQAVADAGFVAVDLYDGCFHYDFDEARMWLIDLDEYRPGPFVLEDERLPGSRRYMAPEEFVRGSTIDERTTVYVLGRTLHHLLDSPQGWRGTAAQAAVVARATRSLPDERYRDVASLIHAWARFHRPTPKSAPKSGPAADFGADFV